MVRTINKDLRNIGSKNVGATNIMRNFGKVPALIAFLLDMTKGFVATLVAYKIYGVDYGNYASLAVVIGHIFPIWIKFKGGKGVATAFGVMAAISWPLAILIGIFWISVFAFTRISSISSISSILISPLILYMMLEAQINHFLPIWIPGEPPQIKMLVFISILVVFMHKDNLYRIIYKKEPKI